MRKKLLSTLAMVAAASGILTAQTATYNFTGGTQTFTVPCGVTSVFIQTWGAQGGSGALGGNSVAGGSGGLGGYAEGFLAVTPGDVLNIFVGGQGSTPTGGFNGGANGGSTNAGGGGGATDVRFNGTAESNRVITAGGGGGGGRGGCHEGSATGGVGGNGGIGGGGVGQNGNDSPQSSGVAGGGFGGNFSAIQGAFGAKGIGCPGFSGQDGVASTTGTGGVGGNGQTCCCSSSNSIVGGGGGGGGQLGGGGGGGGSAGTSGCAGNAKGAGGGGGGGSSYVGGVTSGVVNNGIWLGNGQVTLTWTIPNPSAHTITGNTTLCQGDATTLTSSTDVNSNIYTWTVPSGLTLNSGQSTSAINVTGTVAGTYWVYVMGVNTTCTLNGPTDSIMVTVNASPTIVASATSSAICDGASDTLSVSGASTYMWMPGSLTGSAIVVNPTATTTYTITGVDSLGCTNTGNVTVNVNPLPTVTFSTQANVCLADDTLSLSGSPVGGSFSGTAVTGTAFYPSVAGAGAFAITYNYTDVNGCSSSATDTIDVSLCTTVNNINNPFAVTMMPNPATEVLVVRWDANKAKVNTLEVFDNTGRLVLSQVVTNGSNAELNVSELPAGNYSLVVKTDSNKATYSFMKK